MTVPDLLRKLLLGAVPAACAVLLVLGLRAPGSRVPDVVFAAGGDAPPETVAWAGHTYREADSLAALPPKLQSALGVGSSGLGGVAERGGAYNSTDYVDMKLPMRRFVVAGVSVADAKNAAGANGTGSSPAGAEHAPADTAAADTAATDTAGKDNATAVVALEKGGFSWSVEVRLYSNVQSKPVVERTWTIYAAPKTLRGLVNALTSAEPEKPKAHR